MYVTVYFFILGSRFLVKVEVTVAGGGGQQNIRT